MNTRPPRPTLTATLFPNTTTFRSLVMECLRENRTPRELITRASMRNAARMVAATAGSTNAVLHLLAIAREAGAEWSLEDFEPASVHTPVRSEEHTSELQSLMRISYAVFGLKKKKIEKLDTHL